MRERFSLCCPHHYEVKLKKNGHSILLGTPRTFKGLLKTVKRRKDSEFKDDCIMQFIKDGVITRELNLTL